MCNIIHLASDSSTLDLITRFNLSLPCLPAPTDVSMATISRRRKQNRADRQRHSRMPRTLKRAMDTRKWGEEPKLETGAGSVVGGRSGSLRHLINPCTAPATVCRTPHYAARHSVRSGSKSNWRGGRKCEERWNLQQNYTITVTWA